MADRLTPRRRVELALTGQLADVVPLTIDYNEFFLCPEERDLRNNGMCIVEQRLNVYKEQRRNVTESKTYFTGSDGVSRMRRSFDTPKGTVSELYKVIADHPRIPGERMPWFEEHLFKSPADYAPIEALIRDRCYVPDYETYLRTQAEAGEDIIFTPGLGYSALQEIIYNIMGIDQFAVEWHERRDEVMRLYDALVDDRRKVFPILANSPALLIGFCGNISPEVVGLARFEQYILPHLNELAELLHARGKLLSVHFDGNTRLLAHSIAGSQIDLIDSFTPFPNGDMTMAEARAVWPDKILWINFPGSYHHTDAATIEGATRDLLRSVGRGERFLVGIKELIPKDKWRASLPVILRVLNTEGRLPLLG